MNLHHPCRRGHAPRRERGVVLLFVLIALVIMMIASVALVRSFNGTLFNSGNIAFKRDLQNQAQRAVPAVLATVQGTGGLATPADRSANKAALNYSAQILPTSADGIPTVLMTKEFVAGTSGWTAAAIAVDDQKVKVRYIVDRLCDNTGLETTLGTAHCLIVDKPMKGGSGSHLNVAEDSSAAGAGASQIQVVYRITVRVDGPRDTQAYYQTTFTL